MRRQMTAAEIDRKLLQQTTCEARFVRTARRVIADRINYAQALGIVSQDGGPLCTRRA